MISFNEAYRLTLENISWLGKEQVSLVESTGRVTAEDLHARVWSPSVDVSLKDGYAVLSADIREACPENEIQLKMVGRVAAGGKYTGTMQAGQAVRILSGAPLPKGAEAVLAEEFSREDGELVFAFNNAEPGRNVLVKGEDVHQGQLLLEAGEKLRPTMVGYLASAGYSAVPVVKTPRVGIIATGDEVVAPGKPLQEGKLYASNLVTLASWCHRFGFEVETDVLSDQRDELTIGLGKALERYDAVLTSGGAWKGERDLVVEVLQELGWKKIFHRIRMGPGKAVGFGMVGDKPVFCLPGGPPSNHMSFLQLALPGLMRLAGWRNPGLDKSPVVLTKPVRGQIDWTQFIYGRLTRTESNIQFTPLHLNSRLQMMAASDAVIRIPEGTERIEAGETVEADLLI